MRLEISGNLYLAIEFLDNSTKVKFTNLVGVDPEEFVRENFIYLPIISLGDFTRSN